MVKEKIMLALSDSAMNYVKANASERKRGEFVSQIIETYMEQQTAPQQPTGILERIEARLDRIEAAMLAGKGQ